MPPTGLEMEILTSALGAMSSGSLRQLAHLIMRGSALQPLPQQDALLFANGTLQMLKSYLQAEF